MKLIKSKKEILPPVSKPIQVLGYFCTIIESNPHYVDAKVYNINSKNVPTILGINWCTRLRSVNFNHKSLDVNSVEVEKKK